MLEFPLLSAAAERIMARSASKRRACTPLEQPHATVVGIAISVAGNVLVLRNAPR